MSSGSLPILCWNAATPRWSVKLIMTEPENCHLLEKMRLVKLVCLGWILCFPQDRGECGPNVSFFSALCPPVTWFQPHVTMCPVRFNAPLWGPQSLGVALGFQFGDRWPGLKSWLHHVYHIWHHMWSLWVSACFPVKGDDNVFCGIYNGLLRRIHRSVKIKCDR